MTKKELIEALQDFPDDIDIFIIESKDWQDDVTSCYNLKTNIIGNWGNQARILYYENINE